MVQEGARARAGGETGVPKPLRGVMRVGLAVRDVAENTRDVAVSFGGGNAANTFGRRGGGWYRLVRSRHMADPGVGCGSRQDVIICIGKITRAKANRWARLRPRRVVGEAPAGNQSPLRIEAIRTRWTCWRID